MTNLDARQLIDRHRAVIPSWLTLYYDEPIELVGGEGRRVTDAEGRSYLDFFGGILTNMIGYGVPEVREALKAQLDSGIVHTSTLYLIRSQVDLAERIAELSGIPNARVFFTTSGTEANEAALLHACTARRSHQVIALRGSYHGRSFGAMGITGIRGWSASAFTPLNVRYLRGGDRLRGPYRGLSDADFIRAAADELREVIAAETSGDVAAFIAEPIQGVGGFVIPPDGYFAAVKEVLDDYGIHFISDEVQTGWGRTGEHFWGIQAHGVTPDFMTFAKGLGNGLTIGGVVGRAELMDKLPANSISTFGGNPLSTRAGVATLDYVLSHNLQRNALTVGRRLIDGIRRLGDKYDIVGDVRGKGLIVGVELVRPGGTEPNPPAAGVILEEAKRGGLLIGKGGMYGNALRIAPPLTLTAEEADEGLEILTEAFARADALEGWK
ncbi:MAG: aminotransferase class III-fold pyridoxal phosphate-dependent enzyme [Streptosporangiales bacterium]|nr:aminotransferase class III-fold pyridoxal phosphate-dependent enzyme [Streptosporangiales bacterium]